MTSLAELQHSLQRHVLTGDETVLGAVNGTATVPAQTRAAVYFNAYRLRLIEALASNMPRLQQLLGEQEFAQLAGQYLERFPSRFTSIRWFGDRLAQSLTESHATQPWLAELASWEWALATAFDAPDAQPIGTEALATVAPGDWAELRFQFHPSVQYLQLSTNASALYKALSEEQPAPQPAPLERSQPWLIWRRELMTQYRSLEPPEAAALDVVHSGGTFAAMCESLCNWHEADEVPVQAAGMLKRWLIEELLIAVLPPQPESLE